ncbi:hypothetical protein [Thioalkalivibrio thiocyanodenitrificans]|uniref:hypothetical protein n=1 Tax=Thioalkalivibrio thiocyanodenitrificans TaxID=243063 RepID=UPI00036A1368|nr:hypothetical protein [Thioalkalivibrio thiocyanodenitrificans]
MAEPYPGDTVEWEGSTKAPLRGVLVGYSKHGKPRVRRWLKSKDGFGPLQTVDCVRVVPGDPWGNAQADKTTRNEESQASCETEQEQE